MSGHRYTPEFKDEALKQVLHPIAIWTPVTWLRSWGCKRFNKV